MRETLILLFTCFALFCLSGCGGGRATPTFDVNLKDTTVLTMDASLKRAYKATMSALKSLGSSILFRYDDARGALITAKFPDGDQVWVEIENTEKNVCKVRITVKGLGDELRLKTIVERLKSNIRDYFSRQKTYF
jgi:hypothetical protein